MPERDWDVVVVGAGPAGAQRGSGARPGRPGGRPGGARPVPRRRTCTAAWSTAGCSTPGSPLVGAGPLQRWITRRQTMVLTADQSPEHRLPGRRLGMRAVQRLHDPSAPTSTRGWRGGRRGGGHAAVRHHGHRPRPRRDRCPYRPGRAVGPAGHRVRRVNSFLASTPTATIPPTSPGRQGGVGPAPATRSTRASACRATEKSTSRSLGCTASPGARVGVQTSISRRGGGAQPD